MGLLLVWTPLLHRGKTDGFKFHILHSLKNGKDMNLFDYLKLKRKKNRAKVKKEGLDSGPAFEQKKAQVQDEMKRLKTERKKKKS